MNWLLRSVSTFLTDEAKFQFLCDRGVLDIQDGQERTSKHIDASLDLIAGRLGLNHDRTFLGRFGVPVMARYMARKSAEVNAIERDKLASWFAQAGM